MRKRLFFRSVGSVVCGEIPKALLQTEAGRIRNAMPLIDYDPPQTLCPNFNPKP